MNVLFVSQCSKRALTETRRILDQFAERRGERTWQTPITQAGLDAVRRLLRKTARKNTAVACHWIRGLDHTELLWIVGDAGQFNANGATPTNTTQRNILRSEDENDWHTGEDIRLLAAMAALLHDLGKASVAFQERLRGKLTERNLFRHEWVSLRLFQSFVGTDDDAHWLERLINPSPEDDASWTAAGRYQQDRLGAPSPRPFENLPPLAAAIGWLIVTHHRLPVIPVKNDLTGQQKWLGAHYDGNYAHWLENPLSQITHTANEIESLASPEQMKAYWTPAGPLPMLQPQWREQAARMARKLLVRNKNNSAPWSQNPYVMHLARLCLMLADHHYSGLPPDSQERVDHDPAYPLHANTDSNARLKQTLDEHLLGVAHNTSAIAHGLPSFERFLPYITRHRGLSKRSGNQRFAWQDKAADMAASVRDAASTGGAFIINMASTGCGKTLANARILNALADPQRGFRASYALGLRTLTLQTGRSYRKDLNLNDEELAILVGGSASRMLFEYYEAQAEVSGSASTQALLEEDSHVLYEGSCTDHPFLARALHDPDIKRLISAPMLVCTVDHLMPATESTRAGRQIAPMLRLMSSDLVLDELDDYGLDDLPALTRLVHWAGMLGTRVILSSATLPPALVEGMFLAYQAGRRHYRSNRGAPSADAPLLVQCLWTDEFGPLASRCATREDFTQTHAAFVTKRCKQLTQATPLRRAELIPLEIPKNQTTQANHTAFAAQVQVAALRLHTHHHTVDPATGKRVSFGIVRMANIEPLFEVAKELYALGAPEDSRIHLCVYHARFPLLQRSAIEHQLDTQFNRREEDGMAVFHNEAIRATLDEHPEPDQLFIVLASPVCEVGRDWDADWAIAEPSSMRSLIQLAGRVQRHRAKTSDAPNFLIFDTNLRHFRPSTKNGKETPAAFVRPGFEKEGFTADHPYRLCSHRLSRLLRPEEYQTISALPRIRPETTDPQPKWKLADLEQLRIHDCMLPDTASKEPNAAIAWQFPQAALTAALPQQQPFRSSSLTTETVVFLPDDDAETLQLHRIEERAGPRGAPLYIPDDTRLHRIPLPTGPRIGAWGKFDLLSLLAEQAEHLDQPIANCARKFAIVEVPHSTQGWRYHPLLGFSSVK
jgi:CRISPR-associated endonuclease/helicase Cas3